MFLIDNFRIYHQFKCLIIKSLCLPKIRTIWSCLNFTWDMNYLERNARATGVSDWWWQCRPLGLRHWSQDPRGISLSPLNISGLRSLSLSRLDWTRTTTNKIAQELKPRLQRAIVVAEILVNYHFTVLSLVNFRAPHHEDWSRELCAHMTWQQGYVTLNLFSWLSRHSSCEVWQL